MARIDRINLDAGDNIFVHFEGSSEVCILIQAKKEGLLVSGPMNVNTRDIVINSHGVKIANPSVDSSKAKLEGKE